MAIKYSYRVSFNGTSFSAASVQQVCREINTITGFRLATPNIVYNLILRPPKRSLLPGIVIKRTSHKTSAALLHCAP